MVTDYIKIYLCVSVYFTTCLCTTNSPELVIQYKGEVDSRSLQVMFTARSQQRSLAASHSDIIENTNCSL